MNLVAALFRARMHSTASSAALSVGFSSPKGIFIVRSARVGNLEILVQKILKVSPRA
jgi:hypothetical protein